MILTPAQQSYRARLTAESADPDATGTAPVGTGGTGRVVRLPVRLRVALAAVELPMIRPDADEAADFVGAAFRECDACAECHLCERSGDGWNEPRTAECTWSASRHDIEDCRAFDAADYDAEAWGRVADAVCELHSREVA